MDTRTVSLGEAKITGYSSDYIYQTIERTKDFYEGDLLRKWTPFFSEAKYILDIGANLGNHTLYWATHLPIERMISFEPFPDNFALLSQNIYSNRLYRVQPVQMAVSDRSSAVKVKEFTSDNYGSTTFQYADAAEEQGDAMQSCAIDEIMPELGLPRVDFVKIDTEGFEIFVLKGMQDTLEKYKPVLWIEVSENTVLDVYSIVTERGYSLVDASGANLLFAPTGSHTGDCISFEKILADNMALLSRVNRHYANYERAKVWIKEKDDKLTQLNGTVDNLKEKLNKAQDNYQICKGWLEEKNQKLEKISEEKKSIAVKLANAIEKTKNIESELAQSVTEKKNLESELTQVIAEKGQLESELTQATTEKEKSYAELKRKEEKIVKLLEQSASTREKWHQAEANYQTSKQWVVAKNEKIDILLEEKAALNEQIIVLRKSLAQTDLVLAEEEKFLQVMKKDVDSLNRQLRNTRWKAKRYDTLKDKLYNTWYGKLAMVPLKILRKVKKLFIKN